MVHFEQNILPHAEYGLRDPVSWLPLTAAASSRNLALSIWQPTLLYLAFRNIPNIYVLHTFSQSITNGLWLLWGYLVFFDFLAAAAPPPPPPPAAFDSAAFLFLSVAALCCSAANLDICSDCNKQRGLG